MSILKDTYKKKQDLAGHKVSLVAGTKIYNEKCWAFLNKIDTARKGQIFLEKNLLPKLLIKIFQTLMVEIDI